MKNSLYINPKGHPVTRHSYSGSDAFNFCPRKYELERIGGWKERDQRAAMEFGNAIEAAVRHHHEHGTGAVDEVIKKWEMLKPWTEEDKKKLPLTAAKQKEYVYSKVEVDWENLNQVGQEMIRLYTLRLPEFPYEAAGVKFQMQRNLEMFPNDETLAGIELTAYLDMIVKLKGKDETAILDCKTSGTKIPDFIMLDPQLQTYSFVEKNPNAGFLWFQKVSRELKTGSDVSFLEGERAGKTGVILNEISDDIGRPLYWVGKNEEKKTEMDKLFPPAKKSQEVLAAKQAWLKENALSVLGNVLTKQQVSVRIARIPKKLADDQGESIGQDIVRIHAASETNFFPMHGGVRFPNEKCPRCPMRGICSGDDKLRDDLLVRDQTNEIDVLLAKDAD